MKFSPGPLYMKLNYSDGTHTHAMEVPLRFDNELSEFLNVGEAPAVAPWSGTIAETEPFATWSAALFTALKAALPTAQSLGAFDIWHMASPGAKPRWVYSGSVASGGGGATGAPQIAVVATLSFRTAMGGKFRSCFCDTMITNDGKWGPGLLSSGGNAAFQPWVTYLLGTSGVVAGRDNARIMSFISCSTKENDKLRRRKMSAG